MSVLAPGAVVGGCRIEGVVGRGGMGVVYLARQLELERDVALKLISSELTEDPVARGRFLAEARAAAAVEHPNVVPVHAVGTEDELTYLVMRLIRGDDLRAVVRRDGPLDPSRAAAIIERIGDALDAIHRAGYVHRDVKPPNVLIDDDGHVYLSDFGLAKAALASQGPTTADHWVGTLDYVAPEQIRGAAVDARTDVYALGGVLHFMLTGLPPFVREGDEAKLWAHLHDPPPRPSSTPGVPHGFDVIVARALAKEPADRYASAGELGRDALAAARGDDPTAVTVIASRPSKPAKAKSTGTRRWRGLAGLAAAAVLGAVAALLLTADPEGSPSKGKATPTPTRTPPDPTPEPALTVVDTNETK
ncbi:MAG: serine/threonine-protein kinase, partial [Solirubrobacteraceae bacterium]